MLELHNRDVEMGGWLHKYGRPAVAVFFINWVIFQVVLLLNSYKLIPPRYLTNIVLMYVYIQSLLGIIILAHLLRASGKWWWRYLLLLIGALMVTMLLLLLLIPR